MNLLKQKYRDNENFRIFVQILLFMLLSRLFMLIFVPIFNSIRGSDWSFSFVMNEWDAKRYQFMIDNGYTFPLDTDPQANWAFFPMYMLVCAFVKLLTFNTADTLMVGMFVSNVCIFIAAFTAVKYLGLLKEKRAAEGCLKNECSGNRMMVVILLFFAPYSFYFASTYTEAMFVMFIALFFYCCEKKHFVLAGLMSALASATRIVGCLLVFALLAELYMDMVPGKVTFQGIKTFVIKMLQTPRRILSVLLCPLGAFSYMAFLRFFCGDVWAYKNVQIAWREDTYFPIIGVLWKACTGQIEFRYTYMGWFCIGIFVLYGYMIYRKYYTLAIFGIIALLVPLTSHVMSTCRFTVGSYVAFIGVHDLLCNCNKKLRWAILVFFGLAEIWLLFMWYNSDCWLM